MNYEDYHVHSCYSDDSDYEMEQVVQDAIARGMSEICFTDHVDYGIKLDQENLPDELLKKAWSVLDEDNWEPGMERLILNVHYPHYLAELDKLRKRYQDQIIIKKGLEFGIQSHTVSDFQKLYNRFESQWDFILLSIHQVADQEFWTQEFQQGKTQREYNRAYYKELLKVVRSYKDYSVLAHMDLIIRYDRQGIIAYEEVEDLIDEILKTIIADGKGLEINTSGVRYGLEDLHPSTRILQRYRQLGGRILTFGSDSHKPAHLGACIQQQKNRVSQLGFEEYCTFEHMQPIYHPLQEETGAENEN